jgi:3-phenylpropionate/trans-cinnamate dioxygenase ferredoxin reductase subunit
MLLLLSVHAHGNPTLVAMAADRTGILVVGAGQAGISLVTALRELGETQPVLLVGEEPESPYDRPPLSKTYLRGEHDRASLEFHGPEWYAQHGITLVTGDPVERITRDEAGGLATTRSGRELEFTRLALATGASNRLLPVEGAGAEGVRSVRDLADADRLAPALRSAHEVVVVGGGFIGLEVAASARLMGSRVTVVEATDRLLGRAVTPLLSDFYLTAHERRGTRVLLNGNVVRVTTTNGRAHGVELEEGRGLAADLVVVGIGVVPRTALAEQLGLAVERRGIVVDEYAVASDGVTVAAGDCAVGPNPFARGEPGPTRLESVPHATDQARAAAATLVGRRAAYRQVPWFWSDQGELRLQIAGLPHGADHVVVRGDLGTEAFSILSYRDGLLIAAESVGSSADYLAVKRALEKGMTIPAEAAADMDVPLKRLITRAGG